MFQFTHPRGVRPRQSTAPETPPQFQFTHPRGVRHLTARDAVTLFTVSIHAPTRGATTAPKLVATKTDVSIHAPTRGATDPRAETTSHRCVSIHAPTRGATHPVRLDAVVVCQFQFTHPRGVRLHKVWQDGSYIRFNSRTHEGCDSATSEEGEDKKVSIHAPTRGATVRLRRLAG